MISGIWPWHQDLPNFLASFLVGLAIRWDLLEDIFDLVLGCLINKYLATALWMTYTWETRTSYTLILTLLLQIWLCQGEGLASGACIWGFQGDECIIKVNIFFRILEPIKFLNTHKYGYCLVWRKTYQSFGNTLFAFKLCFALFTFKSVFSKVGHNRNIGGHEL